MQYVRLSQPAGPQSQRAGIVSTNAGRQRHCERATAYNKGSFSFSSPAPIHLNTSIARFDWVPSDKHRVFVRGNLQDDSYCLPRAVSRTAARHTLIDDNSKGITVGDTWTITPRLINDIRYGYVRQGYADSGVGKGDYVDFRFLDAPTSETRSTHHQHSGQQYRRQLELDQGQSHPRVRRELAPDSPEPLLRRHLLERRHHQSLLASAAILPIRASSACPRCDSGFANSYEIAFANLVGTVPQITDIFNYKLTSATAGSALAEGAFIDRHFKANEFEWYAQDAWRIKPNLTITFGLRHTLLQTPYETSGQEVTPTIDTHTWYLQREAAAQQGQIYEADLSSLPPATSTASPASGRCRRTTLLRASAIAYSPDTKTSIRVGAGIYYDHYGEALVNTFDQNGSFGMSSSISNPAGVYGIEGTAP